MSDFCGVSLKGKTAIVTSALRGIGAGVAILLTKQGANVVVNYVSSGSEGHAQEVMDRVREAGSKAILCQASLSNLEQIPNLTKAALEISKTGKIEIIVHNAALGEDANLVNTTPEFYTEHFDCNVCGLIFLMQAAIPHLPCGGWVLFISSAATQLGMAGQTVYAATKAANEALVHVWAKELSQSHGITVNCMNPGPIATDQWYQSDEQFLQDMQPLIDSTPAAARVGEVDNIAPLVAFLCSGDVRWTTGACLSVNRGLYN